MGNLTAIVDLLGNRTTREYDAVSRLTRLTYTNPTTLLGDLQYTYDAAGNRMAVGGSFARTLLPDPVPSATYDAANQQLAFGTKTMTYDANGNLTTLTEPTGTTSFTWDARNRLAALSGPTAGSFAYDAQGRRVRRDLGGELREYQYDGVDIVREQVNGSDVGYLRGLGVDEPFCRIAPEGTTYYLADALSSTVALTDGAGAVGTSYTYEPFGRTVAGGLASRNPFQYTGRENDGTELYYYRARYLSPLRARFVSEDPLCLRESTNSYVYTLNNPLIFTDPSGKAPWYGNYCGPGSNPAPPIDALDAACQAHDDCYAASELSARDVINPPEDPQRYARKRACDDALCAAARGYHPRNSRQRNAQRLIIAIFCD